MERKIYSSLPSNYLTLAQLQERWLNQRNQNNQSESQDKAKIQQSPNRNYLQQPHRQVVAPSNGSASKSKSRPQKQYVVKIRNDSETHRVTAAVESDDRRKSVTEIGDGDKTSCLDLNLNGKGKGKAKGKGKGKGKDSESNLKIRKVKPKVREGSGTTAQEKEKATTESEVKEKENSWGKMNEVEERVRVLSIKSENGKQKGRLGKMNNGLVQQRKYRGEKKMVWIRKDEI